MMPELDSRYTISLPTSTEQEVIEWFEFISNHGDLSSELVKLVRDHIINDKTNISICAEPAASHTILSNESHDLFDSLYNYDAAAAAIFNENQKPKKKMLSV